MKQWMSLCAAMTLALAVTACGGEDRGATEMGRPGEPAVGTTGSVTNADREFVDQARTIRDSLDAREQ